MTDTYWYGFITEGIKSHRFNFLSSILEHKLKQLKNFSTKESSYFKIVILFTWIEVLGSGGHDSNLMGSATDWTHEKIETFCLSPPSQE